MPTTTPDNITTPVMGALVDLPADLATIAGDVQDALIRRANLYVGTSAQRDALASPPVGIFWQDTNGSQLCYMRTASAWVPLGMRAFSGTASQRIATSPPEGSTWQDTDGVKRLYRREGTAWVDAGAKGSASGQISKRVVNKAHTDPVNITFPTGAFTEPPIVTASVLGDARDCSANVDNITSTGCTVYLGNGDNLVPRNIGATWIAVGK